MGPIIIIWIRFISPSLTLHEVLCFVMHWSFKFWMKLHIVCIRICLCLETITQTNKLARPIISILRYILADNPPLSMQTDGEILN